ncbi:hypothetical protein KQI84_09920 [bacterium]|nr:hypothetical protein [bacterium]
MKQILAAGPLSRTEKQILIVIAVLLAMIVVPMLLGIDPGAAASAPVAGS